MGLLDLNFRKAQTKALNSTIKYLGGNWLTPNDHSDTYINLGYKTLPNLYGIISLITQKSSIVPFQVFTVKNKTAALKYKAAIKTAKKPLDYKNALKYKEQAFEEVENSDLERLLLKPNGKQSIEELFECVDGYLLLTGNAFLLADTPGIGKNAKRPSELSAPPSTMVDIISNHLEITGFKVKYLNEEIEPERIGHVKYFNPIGGQDLPHNQLMGMAPLMACRNLMKKYESADIAQGSMFLNMGPAGILNSEGGELTETQAQAVQDKFDQNKTGMKQAGKITITPARLHWTQIGLSPVDLNIIEGKKEMLSEICNVLHFPIALVTENSSTDNNMDNARKMLITDAVIPLVEKRKQMLNSWLAPQFGEDLFIDFDYSFFPEMQEDIKAQAETANLMWWITGNEKRELTGYDVDTDPNMNKKYIQANLVPLEDANLEVEDIDEDIIEGMDA